MPVQPLRHSPVVFGIDGCGREGRNGSLYSTRGRPPQHVLHGEIAKVYPDAGAVMLYHDAVPGFLAAMRRPYAMEFLVADQRVLQSLRPGMKLVAGVNRRGGDYVLEQIRTVP